MCLRPLNEQCNNILEFLPHHRGDVHKAMWFLKQDFEISLSYFKIFGTLYFLNMDQ